MQRVPELDLGRGAIPRKTAPPAARGLRPQFPGASNGEQRGISTCANCGQVYAAGAERQAGASQGKKQVSREENMAISKREFVIGAAAAGGATLLGPPDAAAQSGRPLTECHTHWYPLERGD